MSRSPRSGTDHLGTDHLGTDHLGTDQVGADHVPSAPSGPSVATNDPAPSRHDAESAGVATAPAGPTPPHRPQDSPKQTLAAVTDQPTTTVQSPGPSSTVIPPPPGSPTLVPALVPPVLAREHVTASSSPANIAPTPAAQVAPALASLVQTSAGSQRLTLHLQPETLGHVQIEIERAADATTTVAVTVQRSQTLDLLMRDQPQLQHALDQAGVPQEGRTLTLHLALPELGGAPFGSQGTASGNAGFGHGSGGNGFGHPSSRTPGGSAGAHAVPDSEMTGPTLPPRWLRTGLDITA